MYVAIPKKEWLPSIIERLNAVGCPLIPLQASSERGPRTIPMVYEFPYFSIPLLMVAYRGREIASIVNDPRSREIGGITATDIAIEQGVRTIAGLDPRLLQKQARLSFGATMNWQEKVAKPSIRNLPKNSLVATPYPNITQQFLNKNGVDKKVAGVISPQMRPQALTLNGSTEAAAWSYPDCNAIVDVVVSGDSMGDNWVRELQTVLAPITLEAMVCADALRSGRKVNNQISNAQALKVYERFLGIFFGS